MLEQINVLREKLEIEILQNKSYDEILATSQQIDKLLVKYYDSICTSNIVS